MKTITIEIPDDCDVQIIKNKENKNNKCKFKKGDIIVSSAGLIAIFEKVDLNPATGNIIVYYSTLYSTHTGFHSIRKVDCGIGKEENCRFATKEEIVTLIKALKQKAIESVGARKVLKEAFNIDYIPIIKTYQDLISNGIKIKGYAVDGHSCINSISEIQASYLDKHIASSEKVAKSMLAMAMISQLMPYYGGEITEEEWKDNKINKYYINLYNGKIDKGAWISTYTFLAFHTEEQRDEFFKYNEQLVKNYLMID